MSPNSTPFYRVIVLATLVVLATVPAPAQEPADAFLGSWAFELPDGNPAWLRVTDEGQLQGSLLWSVGSARPVKELTLSSGQLRFKRQLKWKPYGIADNTKVISKPIVASLQGDSLKMVVRQKSADGEGGEEVLELIGKRMPPMPPRPDLASVKFGPPQRLFNGQDLTGWRLSNPRKTNGWRAEQGQLVNETPKKDFGAYGDFGNLRTEEEFEDFQLSIEYNVPAGGNSGVYLRGMYEAQVVDRDSPMQGIAGPGAIFGRIKAAKNAGMPGGQWNHYLLTLVDRHVTVVLNGEKVIDNHPLLGCTGGGLSADDTKPGPIFLQGDHTSVRYRNVEIRRVQSSSSD